MNLAGYILANQYKVVRPIASGATATVFLAFDMQGKAYALKVFPHGYDKRAEREYKIGKVLQHPRINPVLDYFELEYEHKTHACLLMRYAHGVNLTQWRESHPQDSIKNFVHVLEALAFMHSKGIVHRDLKPDNVIVDLEGSARLFDFDISGPVQERFTQNIRMGTIGFLSPEQAMGASPSFASDVYSAGIVLYWLLSAELPYVGSIDEVLAAHRTQPMPPLTIDPQTGVHVTKSLLAFLDKMTAKNPLERYGHGKQALKDFLQLLG